MTIAVSGAVCGVLGVLLGATASFRVRRAVRECRDLVSGAVGSHGTVDPRAVRNVALVRYDALNEGAGQLSFSFALLNAAGDGVVLSSINGRAETRTYAKPVAAGRGMQELSPEEEHAVHCAMLGTLVSAAAPAGRRRASRARRQAAATA